VPGSDEHQQAARTNLGKRGGKEIIVDGKFVTIQVVLI
jgi:hypothetical protein